MPRAVLGRFRDCRTIRFEHRPLDMRAAARECDLAVLNAGHGATAAMLLAGKPVLLVPIHLEQGLLARAVVRNTGAAVEASYRDGADAAAKLDAMLANQPLRGGGAGVRGGPRGLRPAGAGPADGGASGGTARRRRATAGSGAAVGRRVPGAKHRLTRRKTADYS